MTRKLNIKRAVNHPGALRRAAAQAGAIIKKGPGKGNIKVSWINRQAKKPGKIGARARFAKTLRKFRRR